MFEIKITGNTADEIRKDVKELFRTFGIQEQEVAKTEKAKNKKAEKEQAKKNDADKSSIDSDAQSNSEEATGNDVPTTEPVANDTKEDKPQSEPEGDKATYTLEEVRAKAAAMQREGKRDLVKSIITGAGASKLTEVDPAKYNWMMECFEAGCVIEED